MARNPYDGSPEYSETYFAVAELDVTTCTECGALVLQRHQRTHTRWHRLIWNEA